MKQTCERCKKAEGQPFHSFEVESWETNQKFEEKKDLYHLCLSCFDHLTNEAIQTEDVFKRKEINRGNLEKAIQEGLVCPLCKTMIFEDEHTCPE